MVLLVDWLIFAKAPTAMELGGMSTVTLSVLGISVVDDAADRLLKLFVTERKSCQDVEEPDITRF